MKIQEQQLDLALILEDDAEMSDQLSALLSNIEKIQQPWDIIKLCNPPKKKVVFKSVQLHCDFKLCLYKKVPSRATGYVVSLSGAKKLLQARENFAQPVDDDMQFYWEYSGNIFGEYIRGIYFGNIFWAHIPKIYSGKIFGEYIWRIYF